VFNPPGNGRRSKTVTGKPRCRSSAAQASDAGPPPMQAIFSVRSTLALRGNAPPAA
jgi:hypothetical protein